MNKVDSIHLKGSLKLELDQHLINMECEGQSIKLTFSSFKALKKFIKFNKFFNEKLFPSLIQNYATHLKLSYYLTDLLIGESRPDLRPHWLGRYFGLERTQFYPYQLLSYFFKF